jgi:hypothetical protein
MRVAPAADASTDLTATLASTIVDLAQQHATLQIHATVLVEQLKHAGCVLPPNAATVRILATELAHTRARSATTANELKVLRRWQDAPVAHAHTHTQRTDRLAPTPLWAAPNAPPDPLTTLESSRLY